MDDHARLGALRVEQHGHLSWLNTLNSTDRQTLFRSI